MNTTVATASLQSQLTLLERRFPQRVVTLTCGARVAFREAGKRGAPAVVLLHGISSGAASWLHVAEQLADRAHVIAWDAPGYGDSTPFESPAPTADDYAQRLHELLQTLEIHRCTLVGHSLGALMADAYVRGPAVGRVQRLVLISPAGGYGAPEQSEAQARVRSERFAALDHLGVAGIAARIDQRLLSSAADDGQRHWVRWNASRLNAHGYRQAVEMLCGSQLGSGPLTAVPTDIYCGDADVVTPLDACRNWAARLGASCHAIAQAGHASPTEQPQAVAQLLLQDA
ncbi:MAG TPA: alpha/beta hydrolase [Ramlibacter sp.]|nr:alpha/beta hydrolase [Ramlibacter sp.]